MSQRLKRRAHGILAGAALAALLVGCNGGDGSVGSVQTSSTQTTSGSSSGSTAIVAPTPNTSLPKAPPNIDDSTVSAESSTAPLEYAKALFVALNWPASATQRGVPDLTASFGADRPCVWETFKNDETEVYLQDGSLPAPWDAPPPAITPGSTNSHVLGVENPNLAQDFLPDGIVSGFQLPDTNQNLIQYEVRMNRPLFEGIVNGNLYNIQGQIASYNTGAQFLDFPANDTDSRTSVEIKAAWTIFTDADGPDVRAKYHTTMALVNLGNAQNPVYVEREVGLTGLHFMTKPPGMPLWFWTTIEHVDNPTRTPVAFTPPLHQLPIAPDVAAFNARMQAEFAGTVWANYRFNGVQPGQFVDSNGNATLLASSQMETNFATSSSCVTCHGLAAFGPIKDGRPSTFGIFQPTNFPTGYVGNPPAPPPGEFFQFTDFVFSLHHANFKL
jgi:hypothetical protein